MSPSATENGVKPNGVAETDLGVVPVPKVEGDWTVDKAVDSISTGKYTEGTSSPIGYFHLLERLKTTKREGWRRFDINRGESISDHMYRMSMMTMLAPASLAEKIDVNRCIKMALIHDMAESLVGDITPVDNVPKTEKNRREASTMDYITKRLLGNVDGGKQGEQIRAIWQEYEDSKTLESLFVHDIDKIELLLQMVEYEKRGKGKLDLGEFTFVKTKVGLDEMRAWADEIIQEREEFWAGKEHIRRDGGDVGTITQEKEKMQEAYYAGHGRKE
ncbi:HD domain-containing protein [Sordaria brevicollis]|uniref:5'-deoxynucleotidase n=1 Tax=Sordaria brevicollis TaxID=83679 RepID=A0AAE0PHW9_SORBR|nr:HD domain-containing protein [Sordaria brevicollis]